MPPKVWIASLAHRTAASGAITPAIAAAYSRSAPPVARAASHTVARACSSATSIQASLCLMPWNCPIGRPNWTRTLA